MTNNLNDIKLKTLNKILNKLLNTKDVKYNEIKKIIISLDISSIDIDILRDIITLADKINKKIIINIESVQINLNLQDLIYNAIVNKKNDIIYFLFEKINIYEIEENIMEIAINSDNDELISYLIDTTDNISHKEQIINAYNNDHIYKIASKGKLNILIKILQKYKFDDFVHEPCTGTKSPYIADDIFNIVTNISIQAIINNHLNILEYFCPKENFFSIPDIILIYFFKTIEYGHLPIIKYFVENGVSIKHENYKAISIALKYKKYDVIKYFYFIDSSIINILNNDIKTLIFHN